MSDDNPFLDDRDRQASLFGDTDATRTMDRSGETVTGSDSFVDDRDSGGMDPGEQAGLFEETEEMEGQAALGGGTASQTDDGFFGGGNGGGGGDGPPPGALETAMDTFAAETPNKTSDLRREVDPGDLGSRLSGDPTPLLQTVTDRRVARGAVRGREGFREVVSEQGAGDRVGEIESAFVEFTQDRFGGDTGGDTNQRPAASSPGGASESEMQFDATPAVQLSDRGNGGRGLSIGPRGTGEIDPGVGGFSVADDNNTSTRLRDDKGREVTITRRKSGAHGRRKSFGVSMQTEKGRSLGSETVSERVSFGSYADQGVEEAADEVESIIAQMGASRFAMNASEQQMQFDATPAVQLFDRATSGSDSSRPPAGDVLDSGPDPTAEMVGTGLAPSDPEFSDLAERNSRRRRTGDRPDDLAEQLAAQRAAPTLTRPSAEPAVLLADPADLGGNGGSGGSREQSSMMGGDTTTETLEFERRELANAVRDDLPADALAETDDRRRTTVQVDASALSDRQLNRLAGQAADAGSFEDDKAGQVPLTEAERSRIDFTETTVPEARSAKGVFAAEGVDDFVSFYDETLTVDENRDIASRASRDEQGKQMDAGDTTRQRAARAFRSAEQNRLGNIVTGAKRGSDDAVDALVDEVGSDEDAVNVLMAEGGVPESQARGIIGLADTPAQRDALVETNLIRLRSSGRFNRDPTVDEPAAPGQRAPANGRFVGDSDNIIRPADPEEPIMRDPDTGQFVVTDR